MGKSLIGCKYCTIEKGITVKDCFETDEEYANHLEMVHDLVIRREGETEEEATERVKAKNPRTGREDCQCPACKQKRKVLLSLQN